MRFFGVLMVFCVLVLTSCGKSGVSTKIEKSETYDNQFDKEKVTDNSGESINNTSSNSSSLSDEKIVVYIYGEIKKPDVYTLDNGARLCDLVDMAGGYTKNAAIYLNLAARLNDGDQIKVLSRKEYKNNEDKLQDSGGSYHQSDSVIQDGLIESADGNDGGKVNINTADVTKLMELSGIGQSKASAIIEYREQNGAYLSISDIKNVSGIGEALYERIKEKIEV